jgi:hypothetical protein
MYECRCDERLKGKGNRCTLLAFTWLSGVLEHLKMHVLSIGHHLTYPTYLTSCPSTHLTLPRLGKRKKKRTASERTSFSGVFSKRKEEQEKGASAKKGEEEVRRAK